MAKKKTTELSGYMEDLIWMSYRYCIGRHTIAAAHHAGNIAVNSYHLISRERKEFMAHDIRREINNVLSFSQHISIHDYRDHLTKDALSSIFDHLHVTYGKDIKNSNFDWETTKFNVNMCHVEEVKIEKTDTYNRALYHEYSDLIPWIKLANALDVSQHKTIVVDYMGKTEEVVCFSYPYMGWNGDLIETKWVDLEHYLTNPWIDSFLNEEYIKGMI